MNDDITGIPLSLIVPVYNESTRIEKTMQVINDFIAPTPFIIESVAYINDGSTDNTESIISEAQHAHPTTLISYTTNMGKGFAIKTGMDLATGSFALFIDADLSFPLEELSKFITPVQEGYDIVIGSKKVPSSHTTTHQSKLRQFLGKGYSELSSYLLGVRIHDFTAGFKLFSKDAYTRIFPYQRVYRWGFDSEILFLANSFGYQIAEIGVHWKHEDDSKVFLRKAIIDSLRELISIRINDIKGKYRSTNEHSEKIKVTLLN